MKYWILPVVCLFSVITQAASFDCKKASTVLEQLVCHDETLGGLDEQLTESCLASSAAFLTSPGSLLFANIFLASSRLVRASASDISG